MSFDKLARSLAARAGVLARAHGERRLRRAARWYSGRLLWPLFTTRKH